MGASGLWAASNTRLELSTSTTRTTGSRGAGAGLGVGRLVTGKEMGLLVPGSRAGEAVLLLSAPKNVKAGLSVVATSATGARLGSVVARLTRGAAVVTGAGAGVVTVVGAGAGLGGGGARPPSDGGLAGAEPVEPPGQLGPASAVLHRVGALLDLVDLLALDLEPRPESL